MPSAAFRLRSHGGLAPGYRNTGRLRAQDSAALASSIFLVGRKREGKVTGSYETDVQPELETIVRERVDTLWDQGISGADLVIACVGAGLRAFTRFARVEYSNGEQVPAERFLTEVETVVLDSILGRLSKEVSANGSKTSLVGVDPATRFYTSGATPTGVRTWTRERQSSSPTARTSNSTDRAASPPGRGLLSKRRRASIGFAITKNVVTTTRWGNPPRPVNRPQ